MLDVGDRLDDRYVLRDVLGRGGMGEVWRAQDTELDRVVAIKVLLPVQADDHSFGVRFKTEARVMARMVSDPSIVEIYDVGESDGRPYLVLQYIDGESLADRLRRRGRLSADETMALVSQAATALEVAHRSGIVHRDVKPGNLLIRPDGRLVLTDFGIARAVGTRQIADVEALIGTAAYLSPEQAKGEQATVQSDLYSLGVVAYECLTGAPPFVSTNPLEVAMRHVRDEPPPLPDDVPRNVRMVVMRTLAKEPAERWPNAAALAALADRLRSPSGPTLTLPLPEPVPRPRRTPWGILAAAAIALLLVAAGLIALWTIPSQTVAPDDGTGILSTVSGEPSPSAKPGRGNNNGGDDNRGPGGGDDGDNSGRGSGSGGGSGHG